MSVEHMIYVTGEHEYVTGEHEDVTGEHEDVAGEHGTWENKVKMTFRSLWPN